MGLHLELAIVWLIILAAMVLIEIFTLGLTTIWFAAGALVAFLVSLADTGVLLQIILFLIVSVITLILIRPMASKQFNRDRVRTNAQTLIGETAVVIEPIDNLKTQGRVVVRGQEWAARTLNNGERIENDVLVKVKEISGVKLIVEKAVEQ